MTVLAASSETMRALTLSIGVAAALIVTVLLILLLAHIARIQRSVEGLLETAGHVGENTANIPSSRRPRPCWRRSWTRPWSRTAT